MDVIKFNVIVVAVMVIFLLLVILLKVNNFNEDIIYIFDTIISIAFGIGIGVTWFAPRLTDHKKEQAQVIK